jgi:16S rRNA (cytosine967-C5)-methyltransferase
LKYFQHLFDKASEAIAVIFYQNRHADKIIEYSFKNNKKWGKRDRQFFAETVYGCVRWWSKYEFLAESQNDKPMVKAHKAIGVHLLVNGHPLPTWYEGLLDEQKIRDRQASLPEGAVKESFPLWLYELAGRELGLDVWQKTAMELNKPARVVLRANTLRTSRDKLLKELREEGFEVEAMKEEGVPDGIILTQRANVFGGESFKKGLFEVQDGSSQMVATFLAPRSGERIIDACAGAGGKSLHIAALMADKGKLITLDVVDWKVDELKKRARRAGTSIIEPRWIDSTKVIKRLYETADALLLDVPCSGLGVIKRNPDTKWKLKPEKLLELQETQKKILEDYSTMVKPGGRMVYSTCSILPSENQNQISTFISNHPEWNKVEDKTILPREDGFDGFYMALLQKNFK